MQTRSQRAAALAAWLEPRVGAYVSGRDMAQALNLGHFRRVQWAVQDVRESRRLDLVEVGAGFTPRNYGDRLFLVTRVDDSRVADTPDADDLTVAAYHEAGHAIAALALGAEFRAVEIRPNGSGLMSRDACLYGGVLSARWIGADAEIMITMAGPLAEGEQHAGIAPDGFAYESAEPDQASIATMFADAGYDIDARQPWAQLAERTMVLLGKHWPALEALAAALLERRQLSYAEAASLFAGRELTHAEALALIAD